nr:hypothetical protein E-118 - Trypanosoma brucei mitochondrion [Trypanosoma brucei]
MVSPNKKYTQYHWKPITLHKSKLTKFIQLKYNNKHNLNNKHNINIIPSTNQYVSINFDDIKSHVQYILFIFVTVNTVAIINAHIHTDRNIEKDINTIIESIKNIIQKVNIKLICYYYI